MVAISPDSKIFAATKDRTVILTSIETGNKIRHWQVNDRFLAGIYGAFSPDGRLLMQEASGSRMWDVQTGQEAFDFEHVVGQWHSRTCGGRTGIVLGCSDETVRTVRLATGELLADFPLPGPNLMVGGDAMSVDGRVLLARLASRPGPEDRLFGGHRSGPVHFWERAGAPARPFPQVDAARDFVFSADGRWVAAHFSDAPAGWRDWLLRRGDQPKHTIGVFELGTGREFVTIRHGLHSRFAPDGQTLAVGCVDGSVELWDFPLRKPWATILGSAAVAAGLTWLMATRWRWRGRRVMPSAPMLRESSP